MINTLLTMTLTGSAVVLAWLAADKLAGKRLSPIWHERILRLALFFMLVPVGAVWTEASKLLTVGVVSHAQTGLPGMMPVPPAVVPDTVIAVLPGVLPEVTVIPPAQSVQMTVSADLFFVLTIIWGLGAAVTLLRKLWAYRNFQKLLRGERKPLSEEAQSVFCRCRKELRIAERVKAFSMEGLPTPMVVGLLRPTVLLPQVELSEKELRCLFLHELTHIRRHDLWVRFCALLAEVLHWYNPLIYLLDRALKERGEQSCDERVARPMSPEERLVYGGMLLKLAAEPGLRNTGWAVTLSTRESVRKRLGSIIKAGHWTTMDKGVALFIAVGLILCGMIVACSVREPIGVEKVPEKPAQEVPVPQESPVEPESKPDFVPEHEQPIRTPDSGHAMEEDVSGVQDTPEQEPQSIPPQTEGDSGLDQSKLPLVQSTDHAVTIGGASYETYTDNLGITRLQSSVGNPDGLYITELLALETLVDGKYPVNSRGETYGLMELADYVGESPLLIAVNGKDAALEPQSGYLWWEDYWADFSDPSVAVGYESFRSDSSWLNVPHTQTVSGWYLPLYDEEHRQIGTYAMEEDALNRESGEIQSLKNKANQAEKEQETAGETQGAIILDGVTYPRPANNHGIVVLYNCGSGLAPHQQAILDALPNGTYPKNSWGEYYGSDEVAAWLNIEPDLILATGTQGQEGYVWWEDTKIRFETLEDLERVVWNEAGYLLPLYDSEHNQIGWKQEQTPSYMVNGEYVRITRENVDMLRALLS